MEFCLENRVKTVKLEQLVGPGKLIKELKSVDGEDYGKLELKDLDTTPWTVVTDSGITVTLDRSGK
jgi:hypothetical protein